MNETIPKKMVSNKIVIALGTACIILGAFLVAIYFTSTINDTINQKDSLIRDLNDTLNLLKYTVWVNNETVSQTAGNYTSWTFLDGVPAAGYFEVLTTSTTNNTYIEVIYNATVQIGFEEDHTYHYIGTPEAFAWYPYDYDHRINVPSFETVSVFPVLLAMGQLHSGTSFVEIRVGNTNTIDNATETVLVTYYY
ncbi:MAG: hypothetical protein ABSG57_09825 [Candidatus Bathyarchaeia archaeon]